MNIPGLEKPVQPLDVWYSSAYVQDEFRPLSNLTLTAGVRVDIAAWGDTAYANANVDALTFRDPVGLAGAVQHRQAAGRVAALVAARRLQLGRRRQAQHADPRRHRRLHRQAGLRLDLEPDRQHGRPHRVRADREHAQPPVQPEPGLLQADERHRRAGRERGPRRHRPRLQVPADLAHQHRRRPAAAVGPHRHGRAHLQQGRQRHLVLQRQPAGGADDVQRGRSAAAVGRDVMRHGDRDALRDAPQQRGRQPDHERHRADQLERGTVLELRRQRQEEPGCAASACRPPTATASRRR